MQKGRLKLRKGAVERRIKESVESKGGRFIKINWNKTKAHFLTPTGVKKVEVLSFMPH